MSTARPLPKFAYVGSYTSTRRNGRGEGITVHRIDASTGAWTQIQVVKAAENPSWLTLDRRQRVIYSAHGDGEVVSAFRVDEATGQLAALGSQPAKGKNGVRLGVDAGNKFVVCANYSSGTVAVLPINADGSLGPLTDVPALPGKPGPHRTEQASSHPHDVVFDPRARFIVVPDKGLDAVFVFTLDAASGKLVPATPPSVASRPGAGPRHADFHPTKPYAYVLNELDSTITTYRFDGERGGLTPLQVITTLPPSFTGNNTTSEIVVGPGGRFVYASNRGHDSLAIFAVDGGAGTLAPVAWEPTQGKTPRFFAIEPSGTVLYAANMDSDTIVAFQIDGGSGRLTPTGQIIKTGSPSTIVFR
ncbi:MAG: lactonase family protein [Candidatus Rokubacteria bacterium]|nr:lactonase family protein [Candidatus Rokubacteria bacterium]